MSQNKQNNYAFKKVRINFEFNDQLVTLSAEPYKTLIQMREKVMKLLYLCPKKLKVYYSNRDITKDEFEKVGKLFRGKVNVNIKLVDGENDLRYIQSSSSRNNIYISDNGDSTNTKSSYSITNTVNHKAKVLPQKKLINNDFSSQNTIQETEGNQNMCTLCHKSKIEFYCRNCKKFICSECRENMEHKEHLTINVKSSNLDDGIKLYALIIQTDIDTSALSKGISNNVEPFSTNNESIGKENQEIFHKLGLVKEKYDKIISKIGFNQKSDIGNKKINEVNIKAKMLTNDINSILKEVNDKKDKLDFEQYSQYFFQLSSKEKEWEEITKNISESTTQFEINEKINKMYQSINNAINEFLNDCSEEIEENKKIRIPTLKKSFFTNEPKNILTHSKNNENEIKGLNEMGIKYKNFVNKEITSKKILKRDNK